MDNPSNIEASKDPGTFKQKYTELDFEGMAFLLLFWLGVFMKNLREHQYIIQNVDEWEMWWKSVEKKLN